MRTRNTSEYDRKVGSRAQHIRRILSMGVGEVSERLGVSRQTLYYYENGTSPMRANIIRAMCELYGVSPEWLLGMTDTLVLKRVRDGMVLEIREECDRIELPGNSREGDNDE